MEMAKCDEAKNDIAVGYALTFDIVQLAIWFFWTKQLAAHIPSRVHSNWIVIRAYN